MLSKSAATPILLVATLNAAHAAEPAAATLGPRTYVSGKGNDANACIITAPCRTFTRAIAQTADGGEVVVLDSASYGTPTITKAISIVNDGLGTAVVTAPANGAAITVNASGRVNLRGIEIDGANATNSNGINLIKGDLAIDHCVFTRAGSTGLYINPTGQVRVSLVNSTLTDNNAGVEVKRSASVGIANTSFLNSLFGIYIDTGANDIHVSIQNSAFLNLSDTAIFIGSGTTLVTNSQVFGSLNGILNSGGTTLVGNSQVTGNTFGINNSQNLFYTYGSNQINGNTSDVPSSGITSASTR